MKNVYHDVKIEDDSVEAREALEAEEAEVSPQKEAPKKRRRVEYDEKGNVRKDTSTRWMSLLALAVVIILVNLYAFHTCGAEIFGY